MLVRRKDSFLVRAIMAVPLPFRWVLPVGIEACRVEQDTTTWVKVFWCNNFRRV